MTLEEAIKHEEEIVKEEQYEYQECVATHNMEGAKNCRKYAEEHRQLAEWLKELKTHREIHDVLLQMIVDFDLDICCDDLMDNEEEQKICEENCTSKTKGCWVRWAKMKAMEKCKNANLLEQEPCDDCVSRQAVDEMIKAEMPERGMWEIEGDKEKETVCEVCIDLMQKLSALPPVTPQVKWIPVSEKLPEEHKEVLTCSLGGFIEIQSFEDSYDGYWENQNGDWSDIDEVLAWQPLPEPYKAEGRG